MKYLEKENRPWGSFLVICNEVKFKLKKIEVNPGQRLSYQYHNKRSEVWTIIEGIATIVLDGKVIEKVAGESINIPVGSKHRVQNNLDIPLIFIEVQTGSYFGEDDIVRVQDDYNRE